jgi:adenylate cyclase
MGVDEEGTHERLKTFLRQLIEPKIEEHRGRIVKNTGDGILAEFPSVVDAIRCAADIQLAMMDRNADIPDDKRISFRIGINLGDVIVEPGDIFGDGVNIAARLEALAEPGGICLSGVVHNQVRDKLPYLFEICSRTSARRASRTSIARFTSTAFGLPQRPQLYRPQRPPPCWSLRSHCPTSRRSRCCPSII